MPLGARALRLVVASGVVAIVAVCGGSTAAPTPLVVPLSPQEVLSRSGAAMEALETFHFLLRHEVGSTALIPLLAVDEAEGDVVKPDRLSAEFAARLGNIFVKASVIAIGDINYMTNPVTGQWETIETKVSPLGFFNPSKGISGMIVSLEQVRLLEEPGDSGDKYVLEGVLEASVLGPLLGSTLEDQLVEAKLTIRADNFYLTKVVFDGRVIPTDEDEVVRVITLSRFNDDLRVEPPE